MKKGNTDIEFLINAFAYPITSQNETFYLRTNDLKVIGVHIFDNALLGDCEYDSGLSKEQERDVKEAIIAREKNYESHVLIPRLSKNQRFSIIDDFINSVSEYSEVLSENRKDLKEASEQYTIEHRKKGIKRGVNLEYLISGIENEEFKNHWNVFHRTRVKTIATNWLEQIVDNQSNNRNQ